MPRIAKTIVPRIKRSITRYGVLGSIFRVPVLIIHVYREYKFAQTLPADTEPSEFDRRYGVNTDGDIADITFLSDLDIPSKNWIHGVDYVAISPERLIAAISKIPIQYQDFVFVDLGSGKGRALLVASHFPFKRIFGVEFAPQLHAAAEKNIQRYADSHQQCRSIESVCMDLTEFSLPLDPLVLMLNRPTNELPLRKLMNNIRASLSAHPRQMYLLYFAPKYQEILELAHCLVKILEDEDLNLEIYRSM